MKHPLVVIALRVLAVACSLSMLGGYVWFSQRKAQSSVPASAASPRQVEATAAGADRGPATIILDTKSVSAASTIQAAAISVNPSATTRPSTWLMSGSKSFSGASTVVADQLQLGKFREAVTDPAPSVMPGSKAGVLTLSTQPRVSAQPTTMMPGSKGSGGVFTPDQVDAVLQPTNAAIMPKATEKAVSPVGRPKAMMPGSKFAAIDLEFEHPPPVGGWTGDKAVLPDSRESAKGDFPDESLDPSKPLALRGALGSLQASPDGAGSLLLAKPLEPSLPADVTDHPLISEKRGVYSANVVREAKRLMLSGSKSGPVMIDERAHSRWFIWDLGEALRELSAQLKRGFNPAATSPYVEPRVITGSTKSAPVIPIPIKPTPSVLTLPDQNPQTAQP